MTRRGWAPVENVTRRRKCANLHSHRSSMEMNNGSIGGQERDASRDTRHVDPEDPDSGTDAWIRDRAAHPAGFRRGAAGGRRIAVSGAAAVAGEWLGGWRVGRVGEQ